MEDRRDHNTGRPDQRGGRRGRGGRPQQQRPRLSQPDMDRPPQHLPHHEQQAYQGLPADIQPLSNGQPTGQFNGQPQAPAATPVSADGQPLPPQADPNGGLPPAPQPPQRPHGTPRSLNLSDLQLMPVPDLNAMADSY